MCANFWEVCTTLDIMLQSYFSQSEIMVVGNHKTPRFDIRLVYKLTVNMCRFSRTLILDPVLPTPCKWIEKFDCTTAFRRGGWGQSQAYNVWALNFGADLDCIVIVVFDRQRIFISKILTRVTGFTSFHGYKEVAVGLRFDQGFPILNNSF